MAIGPIELRDFISNKKFDIAAICAEIDRQLREYNPDPTAPLFGVRVNPIAPHIRGRIFEIYAQSGWQDITFHDNTCTVSGRLLSTTITFYYETDEEKMRAMGLVRVKPSLL